MLSRLFATLARTSPRIVLDTNVLISASLAEHGFSASIIRAVRRQRVRLVLSPYILNEFSGVAHRPHIVRKYKGINDRIDALVRFLNLRSVVVEPREIERVIIDDPKDDAILACAFIGKAEFIVTGDEHLLNLGSYRGIRILNPRDFVTTVLRENLPLSHGRSRN